MEKEKIEVLFRKDRKDGTITAFIPSMSVFRGEIGCYQHIGQHGTASINYYNDTLKASEKEYRDLLSELKLIYDDYEIVVRHRLNYDKLVENWERNNK